MLFPPAVLPLPGQRRVGLAFVDTAPFTHLLFLPVFLSRWPLHGRSGPRHVQQPPKARGLPGWLPGLPGVSGLEWAPARPHQRCPPSQWADRAGLWRYHLCLFKLQPCCKPLCCLCQCSFLGLPSIPFPVWPCLTIGVFLSLAECVKTRAAGSGNACWHMSAQCHLAIEDLSWHGHQASPDLCLCFLHGWKGIRDFYLISEYMRSHKLGTSIWVSPWIKRMSPTVAALFNADWAGGRKMVSECLDGGREGTVIEYLLGVRHP